MRGTMKDQKNYTLFFILNTHLLDKSMVQKSLIFPMAMVSQVFLMIAFICFRRLSSIDPDSVNLGWGPEIYFMKYPSPSSPYLKGRWSYTVTGFRPFLPLGRYISCSLCLCYTSPCSLQVQLLPILQTLIFTFYSQKALPWPPYLQWYCDFFFLVIFQPPHSFHFLCSADHNLNIFY